MRTKSLLFLFAFLAVLPFGGTAFGQVLYGSIVGDVTDPSGAAVPNVAITITDAATGQSRSDVSDSGGRFTFSDVPTGNYTIKFVGNGFRPVEKTGVAVTVNTVFRSDVGAAARKCFGAGYGRSIRGPVADRQGRRSHRAELPRRSRTFRCPITGTTRV